LLEFFSGQHNLGRVRNPQRESERQNQLQPVN